MALCISLLRYLLDLGDSLGDADQDEFGEEEGERRFDFSRFVFECFVCLFLLLSGIASTELLVGNIRGEIVDTSSGSLSRGTGCTRAVDNEFFNDVSCCSNRSWRQSCFLLHSTAILAFYEVVAFYDVTFYNTVAFYDVMMLFLLFYDAVVVVFLAVEIPATDLIDLPTKIFSHPCFFTG